LKPGANPKCILQRKNGVFFLLSSWFFRKQFIIGCLFFAEGVDTIKERLEEIKKRRLERSSLQVC
jgi:hypothetical protein